MEETRLENRLTTLETNQQYIAEQIIDMQDMQNDIKELALSVNSLACSVKRLCEDMCSVSNRLQNIEGKAGKRWEQLIGIVMSAIVGGLIGYLISML
jgi:uncharacterized coiled-coil protein SlyX